MVPFRLLLPARREPLWGQAIVVDFEFWIQTDAVLTGATTQYGCTIGYPRLLRDYGPDRMAAERWTMPNLYFIQSGNNSGMLRAVLSREEGNALLTRHAADYIGGEFPKAAESRCALLRIFNEEADKAWRAGFYLFASDVMQIEEALREFWQAQANVK